MAVQQGIALVPNPQMVGNAFVTQYYNVLHISPQMVHKFYQECSLLGRPDPNGQMITVTTMEGINQQIMSLDYSGFKAVIKTIDSQESYNNGVLVLVTGSLTFENSVARTFTQSFFLAPQEKGYFVLNDIFKYVDEEPKQPKQNLALINGYVEHAAEAPVSEPVVESEPVAENGVIEQSITVVEELVVEEVHNHMPVREITEGSADRKESAIDHLPAAVHNEGPPAHETPVVIQDAPKKSYASIVKVMKENAALSVAVQKPSLARAVPSAERQATTSSPPKASANESFSSTPVDMADNSASPEAEGNGCSIYIKHLPVNVTPAQVEEEFKKFGAIKPSGVQVRSKQGGFCYGFVEFEEVASVQTALQASPIIINGRQAFVEEKKTTSGTRATRGRPFPARGGFRNDGMRARGAYGGRGNGRTDFVNGAYGGRGNGRTDFVNRADLGNRARGSFSGRAGWFSDTPEGYQRDDQMRNVGRGTQRGGMMTSNGPRVGSVAA